MHLTISGVAMRCCWLEISYDCTGSDDAGTGGDGDGIDENK